MRSQIVAISQISILIIYSVYWFYQSSGRYLWLNILYPFALISIMFPVNYMVNNIINLFYPSKYIRENSKYYMCAPHMYLADEVYPDITIVIPVYKEDFYSVIASTLASAVNTRDAYNGNCNIVVLDDGFQLQDVKTQNLKRTYYDYHGFGMVARPVEPRPGKFKKASNLNNHLRLAVGSGDTSNQVITGDYSVGKYIILIDSDSRIDHVRVNEMVSTIDYTPNVGYIQFHTEPLDNSYVNFFSRQIAQFTKNLYDLVFVIVTVGGEPAPLVGHNAIIRTTTLHECATLSGSGRMYWSENKVSEDFDFSFRAIVKGYYGVYATFATFQEGISFDLHSELLKMSKFTYGAIEMLTSSAYYHYIGSLNVPWAAKVNITSYLFSYISLALAPIMSLTQLIISCYIEDLYKITLDPVILMAISFLIFSILGPISTWIYLRRISLRGHQLIADANQTTLFFRQIVMGLFMFTFYSGSLYWFLLGIIGNKTWGATNKEQGKVIVSKTYKYHYLFTMIYLVTIILILCLVCANWYGAIPSLVIITIHALIPILWRGSTNKNKTRTILV